MIKGFNKMWSKISRRDLCDKLENKTLTGGTLSN